VEVRIEYLVICGGRRHSERGARDERRQYAATRRYTFSICDTGTGTGTGTMKQKQKESKGCMIAIFFSISLKLPKADGVEDLECRRDGRT